MSGATVPALTGALVAALILTGCTGSPDATIADDPAASSATPPTTTAAGTGRTSRTPTTSGRSREAPRLSAEPAARIALPAGMRVVGLTLAGSRLAWSGCLPCAGTAPEATDLYVADLPSGRPRAVARTRFGRGSTSVVGLAGTTLVWIDRADHRGGNSSHARWALRALDLVSSVSWTITDGGRPGRPQREPLAFAGGGRVAWQLFDPVTAGGEVWSADLRTHVVRRVARRLPGPLRAVTARGLVYVANDPEARTVVPDAPVPADAYLLPAGGGNAVALTAGHDVADATADDERLLWSTPHGEGEALWSRPLGGGAQVLVFTGRVLGFAAGRGFATWTTGEGDPVVELGSGGPRVTLPDVPAAGGVLAADGDRLALLTVPDRGLSGPLTLVVRAVTGGS